MRDVFDGSTDEAPEDINCHPVVLYWISDTGRRIPRTREEIAAAKATAERYLRRWRGGARVAILAHPERGRGGGDLVRDDPRSRAIADLKDFIGEAEAVLSADPAGLVTPDGTLTDIGADVLRYEDERQWRAGHFAITDESATALKAFDELNGEIAGMEAITYAQSRLPPGGVLRWPDGRVARLATVDLARGHGPADIVSRRR